jgi:ribosomal protein S18 acetylase RimI-like enzyme
MKQADSDISVRRFVPQDYAAVRSICLEAGGYTDIFARFSDLPDLVTDALLSYYREYEAESLFVAVDAADKVIGYCAGCVSTGRYERVFAGRVAPRLLLKAVRRGVIFSPGKLNGIIGIVASGFARTRLVKTILPFYPAHCHINISAAFRRRGVGGALLDRFTRHVRERKVCGIHVSSLTSAGKRFFAREGFEKLAAYAMKPFIGGVPVSVWLMGKKIEGAQKGDKVL